MANGGIEKIYDHLRQDLQEEYEAAVRVTGKDGAKDEDFERVGVLSKRFALFIALGALIGAGAIYNA